jgi:hypothetical protein
MSALLVFILSVLKEFDGLISYLFTSSHCSIKVVTAYAAQLK